LADWDEEMPQGKTVVYAATDGLIRRECGQIIVVDREGLEWEAAGA